MRVISVCQFLVTFCSCVVLLVWSVRAKGGWTCSFMVNTDPKSSEKPTTKLASVFASTQKQGKEQASAKVIERLREHCTVIEVRKSHVYSPC